MQPLIFLAGTLIISAAAAETPSIAGSSLVTSSGGSEVLQPTDMKAESIDDRPKAEIVVEGKRERQREAVREFAQTITRRPREDLPVERFRLPVCPLVYGFKPQYAEVIAERISQNAQSASVPVAGKEGCKPNIYVLFVRDIDAGISSMEDEGGALFEHLLDYQIDRVVSEVGPVRAWNVAEIRDERGIPMPFDPVIGGYVNKPGSSTRSRLPVTMETMAAIVVIDVSALDGKSLTQLADYATMRALAPTRGIDDPQSPRFDTILTLFSGGDAPPEMTAFDRAYLRTIYNYPATLEPNALYQRVAMELMRGDGSD